MEKSEKKVLIENSISIAITQGLSYILPIISLPYLSRVLGSEKFGMVYWALSLIAYFTIFVDYGFILSAVKEISINRYNNNKISEIFSSVIVVKLTFVFLSIFILSILILFVPKFYREAGLFYLTSLSLFGTALYPAWFFQGIEHMKYVTFLNFTSQIIFIVLIFVFVKKPEHYIYVALLNSTGIIISGILGITLAIKRFNIKLYLPSKNKILEQIKNSFQYFCGMASQSLYTNTNLFFIGFVAEPAYVGYYVAAEKIFNSLRGIVNPISTTFYPNISKSKDISLYKKILFFAIITLFIIIVFIYIFSPQIINIFYGDSMNMAYKILRILLITFFIASLSGLIGYPVVAALGYPKVVNLSLIIAAISNIICLGVFYYLNLLNVYSLAYLTIVPYFLMLIIRISAIIKYDLWNTKKEH